MPEEAQAPRVGLVLVSHSAGLAQGAAELARAMARDVRIIPAGGVGDPPEMGTDAARVQAAIEEAWSDAGVLVLMDLGSALLSTELALDLLSPDRRHRVRLSSAPLVEGAVSAAVAAQVGEPLERVATEAEAGLAAKAAQLGAPAEPPPSPGPGDGGAWEEAVITVDLPLGLHARPAALLVQTLATVDAEVRVGNATTGAGPVGARSLNAVAVLQVGSGQELKVEARGPGARQALSRVRELAARHFDEPQTPEPPPPMAVPERGPAEAGTFAGLPASPGRAVGPLTFMGIPELRPEEASAADPVTEEGRLDEALRAARAELTELRERTLRRAGRYEAAIIDAELLFLDDPELSGRARERVRSGAAGAAVAWAQESAQVRQQWEQVSDPRLRLRVADLDGVSRRVLGHLLGAGPSAPRGTGILAAEDLTPADAAQLDPDQVLGIATAAGGPTSHSAILARSLGIPAAVGLGPAILEIAEGTEVLLDGERGTLRVSPDPEQVSRVKRDAAERRGRAAAVRRAAQERAVTRDGTAVEVAANIGSVADAAAAVAGGADAVGLLRTEFLFQSAQQLPDEEEQFRIYAEIAGALQGRPLTIRTMDVGADKPMAALPRPTEANPALGVRGLRLGLERPELLDAQLRAIVRLARESPVRVMFPMVATRAEVEAAWVRLEAVGVARENGRPLEVGIMVEVPAAALCAPLLAPLVDFMSIGTNDLSQYTMAADRGNAGVGRLADPFHPAVLRLIAATATAGRAGRAWVGVCGELAGERGAARLLIGLGVRELSVAPRRVAEVKEAVRATELGAAEAVAARALELSDADSVRQLLAGDTGG